MGEVSFQATDPPQVRQGRCYPCARSELSPICSVCTVVVAALDPDTTTHPRFRAKLEGIGYGFVVPVFFYNQRLAIGTAPVIRESPGAAACPRVPGRASRRPRDACRSLSQGDWRGASSAAALLQATSLPVIVTAAQMGLALGVLLPVNAAALICAGVLSTLIFPAGALAILRRQDF